MYVASTQQFSSLDAINASNLLASESSENSSTRLFEAGSLLFCEGDDSDCVYEIIHGVVRSSKVLCDGRRQIVSFGYPSDLVGISHDCTYHNDCEAISDVVVRIYHKNACNASIDSEPEFCRMLLKHTAAEISGMQEHFMMLGRKSAVEKVASFLAVLMDRVGKKSVSGTGFDLPMSRSDIADFLGLTIETISRTLTKLRKDGIIALPNSNSVQVLNAHKLREFAEDSE